MRETASPNQIQASMRSAIGCHAMSGPPLITTIWPTNSADCDAQPGQKKLTSVATRNSHGQNPNRSSRAIPLKVDSPVAIVQRSISPMTTNCVTTPIQNSHQMENPFAATRLGHSRNSPLPSPMPSAMTEGPMMYLRRGTRDISRTSLKGGPWPRRGKAPPSGASGRLLSSSGS